MTFEQWLQSRLTAHGFACGGIDGVVGPATVAAIKGFQRARKLPLTGRADPQTVAALRLSSSAVPDVVRAGLPDRDTDPATFKHTSTVFPRQAEVLRFYGAVGTNQTRVAVPWDMYLAWQPATRIRTMTLHKKVAASAERASHKIAGTYSKQDMQSLGLHLFGGSLNVRKMRGGSRYSMHSWGIAIDFDPVRNQLRWRSPRARLSHSDAVPFWQAWESEGWLSLGRARNFDWMHVQAARL